MLHSKVVVIDRQWAIVGSANIDERSFLLNFELTAVLHDAASAGKLCEDFDALRTRSRRINKAIFGQRGFGESMILGAARLASPLL
jgi:cardiolipin synthase A/B